MIFLLSYTDDDFGGRIVEQLLPYVANSSFEDYYVCIRFLLDKTKYVDVYKRTQALGSETSSVTTVISSKISPRKLLEISGPTVFERNLFSKLMLSTDYIVSTMHRHSTTPKSETLLKGIRQIGNTNVKIVELELTEEVVHPVDSLTSDTEDQPTGVPEADWSFHYVPAPPSNRNGFDVHFVDFPQGKPSTDISMVLDHLRLEGSIPELPKPSNEQKRQLRDAGIELVPLVAELQAIKSQYQSDDVAEMQVNEGYKAIEQIWRRIWFDRNMQSPLPSHQSASRLK